MIAAGIFYPQHLSVAAAEKRPHASRRPAIEIGIGYDHRPGGMRAAPAVSVPFRAETYLSDSVDLVFSGWAGYSRHTGEDAFGALVAPGLAYWIDARTRVTTQLRMGFEYFNERRIPVFVGGGDALAEHFAPLHPDRPYSEQDYIVPAVKFGALTRVRLLGEDYSYLFAGGSLAYERGLGGRKDAPFHLRAKLMAGGEVQLSENGNTGAFANALFELRAVRPDGRLIAKGEIGVTSDFADYTKIGMTLSRGF